MTTAGVLVASVRPLTIVDELSGGVPVAGANVTWNRCVNTLGRVASLANFTSRKIRVSWNGPHGSGVSGGKPPDRRFEVGALERGHDRVSRLRVNAGIAFGRIERLETIEHHGRRRHVHDQKLVDQVGLVVGAQNGLR